MFIYHQLSIADSDHFIPSDFPQLQNNIQQIIAQLATEPAIKTDMLLSFVKDHAIDSNHVNHNPRLAMLISAKALPLQLMEDLFEASRKNPAFKKDLEDYIRNALTAASAVNITDLKINTVKMQSEVSSVTAPVAHHKPNNVITRQAVAFSISRVNNRF